MWYLEIFSICKLDIHLDTDMDIDLYLKVKLKQDKCKQIE